MELVFLVGLQGAGKSTFYRERLRASHALVSKDLWPNARRREARQLSTVEALLWEGRHVAVDNTNLTRAIRAATLALGHRLGARCLAYFFPVALEACLQRNARRTGAAQVPEWIIRRRALEVEPPTRGEGFDAVFTVENTAAGFVVRG